MYWFVYVSVYWANRWRERRREGGIEEERKKRERRERREKGERERERGELFLGTKLQLIY